jgi:hypothetical protein
MRYVLPLISGMHKTRLINRGINLLILWSIAFAYIPTVAVPKLIHLVVIHVTSRTLLIQSLNRSVSYYSLNVYLYVILLDLLVIVGEHNRRMGQSLLVAVRAYVSVYQVAYFLFHDQTAIPAYVRRHSLYIPF